MITLRKLFYYKEGPPEGYALPESFVSYIKIPVMWGNVKVDEKGMNTVEPKQWFKRVRIDLWFVILQWEWKTKVKPLCYFTNGFLYCECGKCKQEDYPLPKDFNSVTIINHGMY